MQKIFTPQSWFEEAAIFKVAAGEDIHPEVLKTAIKVKQSKDLKDINLSPLALDFGEMHISKTDTLKAESSLNLSSLLDAKREDIANEEGLGLSGKPDDMLEFNSFIGTMASQVDKIKKIKAMCDAKGVNPWIEVDGGVSPTNAYKVIEAGANALVAGSAVFNSPDYAEAIAGIKASKAPK